MTLNELITALTALRDEQNLGDCMMVVRGYEAGVNEIGSIDPCTIALNVHDQWYYGRHERFNLTDQYYTKQYQNYTKAPAIELCP